MFAMWFSVVVCIPPLLSAIAYAFYDARYREYALLNDEGEDLPTPTFPISRAGLFNLLRCFTTSFWLVCYLWVVVAGIVFSSLHFTTDAFEERFGFSAVKSGLLSGSLVLVAGLSSPVIGVLQDRIGRRATILTTCCGLLSGGCALCALALTKFGSHIALYTGLTFMAIGFAGAPVTLMSCVALSVEGFVIAAALGLYKGTENAGLTVLHVSLGAMRDVTGGYVWAFFLLAGVGLTGVLASLSLGRRSPHLGKGTGAASSEEAF